MFTSSSVNRNGQYFRVPFGEREREGRVIKREEERESEKVGRVRERVRERKRGGESE